MKRKIIMFLVFVLVVILGMLIIFKGMNISNTKDEIKTTTTTAEPTTTVPTTFRDKEPSYWENKAREYYLTKNPKDEGIVVNSELNKNGINLLIMIGDKVIDVYAAGNRDDYFINLKGEKIILE